MELGKKITLYVVKKTPMGIFLNDKPEELMNSMTLSKEDIEAIGEVAVGDAVDGYCFYGLDGKLKATTKPPLLCNGEIGVLEAVESNHYGAFLHWGYEKDLFMPFSEQRAPVKKGHKVLVGVYTDKSGRLCASQRVKKVLDINPNYKEGDNVEGIIYDISEEIGAFVALERKYFGLILSNEVMPYMKIGTEVVGRITKVREDGKVNITLNKFIQVQMDEDARAIYDALVDNDGYLPYHDKTDSDTIKRVFNMSKKAFKRAIGKLYKDRQISIDDTGIHIDNESK